MLEAATLFTAIFYLVIIGVAHRIYKVCHRHGDFINWLVLGIHGLIYSLSFVAVYNTSLFDKNFYNYWSIALRVHSLGTIAVYLYARYLEIRGNGRHGC